MTMKFSAILIPTLVIALASLTVNAQDHPKKDTAGVHHKGPEGKKEFAGKDGKHPGGPVKDSAGVKHKGPEGKGAKPAHHEGKPKEAAAAPAKQ
jgi:hypothetical protein